jgi:putative transposase
VAFHILLSWHISPIQTSIRQGDISGFNARLRDELLNETAFSSLAEIRILMARWWRRDDNADRPTQGSAG